MSIVSSCRRSCKIKQRVVVPRNRFEPSIRWTLVIVGTLVLSALAGCEPSGPAMTGTLLQDVDVSIFHPYATGGSEGSDNKVSGHGWSRVYWAGRNTGDIKIEIDEGRLRIVSRV